jgi:glycosyltransferase involved in cell wall biosynthesis
MTNDTVMDFWHPPVDPTILHTPHSRMLSFHDDEPATLTIAIPTFRRPVLLQETLRSVLAQTDLSGVRIVVIDNDPESTGHEGLLAAMPELRDQNFQYRRNHENMGLFGNWNACVAAADTPWVSVLNDDDLLDPVFVATMRAVLDADPTIDALACSMREFDTRGERTTRPKATLGERMKLFLRFGVSDRIVLTPESLFFRNIAGSSLGLIVRPDVLRAVGGYQRSEYPAADYLLNVRLAARFKFVRLKQVLTLVRIEENVSAKLDVMLDCLRQGREIQTVLLNDRRVPRWWDRLSGPFLRTTINEWNARWHVNLTSEGVGRHARIAIPSRSGLLTKVASMIMRAF